MLFYNDDVPREGVSGWEKYKLIVDEGKHTLLEWNGLLKVKNESK